MAKSTVAKLARICSAKELNSLTTNRMSEFAEMSGVELLARFDALHARMTAEHPEIDNLTWEEIRDMRES